MNYYNEFDPKAAAWLRELIKQGVIPPGDVDERSITEIKPHELAQYIQCHFFAGIGGWAFALALAGWSADRPVGTGSCPCQPFSAAGKGLGSDDERHLWPVFFNLIVECRALGQKWAFTVFGEQVASAEVVGNQLEAAFVDAVQRGNIAEANRLAHELARSPSLHFDQRWLDGIRTDLEGAGYALRCEVLGAHSAGSPNIRQRLYWLAYAPGRSGLEEREEAVSGKPEFSGGGGPFRMADAKDNGLEVGNAGKGDRATIKFERHGDLGRLADTDGGDAGAEGLQRSGQHRQRPEDGRACGGVADSDSDCDRQQRSGESESSGQQRAQGNEPDGCGKLCPRGMGDAKQPRLEGQRGDGDDRDQPERLDQHAAGSTAEAGAAGRMADAAGRGRGAGSGERSAGLGRPGEDGFWDAYDLLPCTDGKARRVEPGAFPLAHGVSGRVGLLRGYGNAINPWAAAEFIKAGLKIIP